MQGRDAPATALALYAGVAVCVAFAFVGLGASGYSIDELFVLFLIDHDGGPAEVVRRALTDTHPPAYYLLLYGWSRAFGLSEAMLRLLSAVLAVAALGVVWLGLRRRFSPAAVAFALMLGAGSKLFFEEAQEVRNYGLGMLAGAGLLALTLALDDRLAAKRPAPWPLWLGLWATATLGAFNHFYLLLMAGAAYLFLLIAARDVKARALVVVSGLAVLLPELLYIRALLHGTEQNIQAMWFSNSPGLLGKQLLGGFTQAWTGLAIGAGALLAVCAASRRAPAGPPPAPLRLSVLVIGMTILGGLAVSFLLAPSFGRKNLIMLGPFFWTVGAWLYDKVGAAPAPHFARAVTASAALLALTNALTVATRPLNRNEPWRETAAYVDAVPGCAAAPLPVVLPFLFGPPTPFFRRLAETEFFGRYDRWPERLTAYTPREFTPAAAPSGLRTLLSARARSGCPLLAWGVHDLKARDVVALRASLAATVAVPLEAVAVKTFDRRKPGLFGTSSPRPTGYVFERAP
jgi:hypothetical protein